MPPSAAVFRMPPTSPGGPVETVLASRTVSNLVVLLVTLATAAISTRQGGLYGLADNLVGVGVVWGAAFGLIHYGRQWRDVKPPERKPRPGSADQ